MVSSGCCKVLPSKICKLWWVAYNANMNLHKMNSLFLSYRLHLNIFLVYITNLTSLQVVSCFYLCATRRKWGLEKTIVCPMENINWLYVLVHLYCDSIWHMLLISFPPLLGATGRAFLFNKVVNLNYSEVQDRVMLTGRHMVRDVSCKNCDAKLGWVYEFATEDNQRYKEGRVILERALVTESEGIEEHVSHDSWKKNSRTCNCCLKMYKAVCIF